MSKLLVIPEEVSFQESDTFRVFKFDSDILLSACRLHYVLTESILRGEPIDEVIISGFANSITNIDCGTDTYWVSPNTLRCFDESQKVDGQDNATCVSIGVGCDKREYLTSLTRNRDLARLKVYYSPFTFHAYKVCEALEFDYRIMLYVTGNICTQTQYVDHYCTFKDLLKTIK